MQNVDELDTLTQKEEEQVGKKDQSCPSNFGTNIL